MKELDPEERQAIAAMADVVRAKEAGRLSVDEALRAIKAIVDKEEARVLAKQKSEP